MRGKAERHALDGLTDGVSLDVWPLQHVDQFRSVQLGELSRPASQGVAGPVLSDQADVNRPWAG